MMSDVHPVLYHGTKISPEVVLVEGLKPVKIMDVVNSIKRKYKVGAVVTDMINDAIRSKRQHLYVYLTSDFDEAASYALGGSNFANLVEIAICDYLGKEWVSNRCGIVYLVKTGQVYADDVEVKMPLVPPEMIVGIVLVGGD